MAPLSHTTGTTRQTGYGEHVRLSDPRPCLGSEPDERVAFGGRCERHAAAGKAGAAQRGAIDILA